MIQIGEKASPTFAQPLELMSDCHRRVEKFLRALILVTEQACGGPLNHMQRDELQTALRYFREAAPKHTADEEESLFPRIRKLNSEQVSSALQQIAELESDHEVAKGAHDRIEQIGQRWLATDAIGASDVAELQLNLRSLADIYARHIQVEDREVFPLASRVLTPAQLQEIGEEMAQRRNQKFLAKTF